MATDIPIIKAGTAKIIGKLSTPNGTNKHNTFVNVTISLPISGEYVKYKTFLDQSGKFAIDIDVETTTSLISLSTSIAPEEFLLIKLTSSDATAINIAYNATNDIENINIEPVMAQNDFVKGFEVMNKMISYRPDRAPQPLYNKSTDYFLNYAKTILSERLTIVQNDTLLSKELKEILAKDFHLFLYNAHVFDYEREMMLNYHNTSNDKNNKPELQKIDKSYFHFLKDFKLNDPQYLYCFTFPEFQKTILQNEILDLPEIGESSIPAWLKTVKAILSDLVGFDNGQYYDILAANAYGRQLNEELRPLSEKQKKNIENYWENGEIAKILFRKNQKVVALDKFKSIVIVNDVSLVANDKVIETILAKHKNKVVFIDFWATWCSPCLEAIQEFRSTKNEFHDKNVVFVYLTNGSSPRKLWEEKIQGIGSEHYYLKASQWEYIMEQFGFEAIPSYLLYDKEGIFNNKFTGFPGNEKVKEMINNLL